jgi:hypothetical protein
MANLVYDGGKARIMSATTGTTPSIDLAADTMKVALVSATYTPNQGTHVFFSDVTNEVTGTGYTAGGATLASITVTADTTNHRGVFDAADATWASSTITARGAVIYKSTGTAATSPLLGYVDFTTDQISTNGTFAIVWASTGILYIG